MKISKYILLLLALAVLPIVSFADDSLCNVYISIKPSVYNNEDRVVFNMINTKKDQEYKNIAFSGQTRVSVGEVECGDDYNIYATALPMPRRKLSSPPIKSVYTSNPIALNHDIDISYPLNFKTLV
ncbi:MULTISPECIES: hypothetical protein [unclassified Francisella]|uniref:hypothetical protein n=1 Tax=unclassified Francisella TaxID=2610885 RepID=UPI002E30F05A|nr:MULTISPECIES: hypothetical protein [unclassified Francisella]MED7818329.1 hypothetical protein [Francisella sp. 19S2-4]MED7829165.1 hypothetical protein [Francisella sp. 19S2-10]